MSSNTSIPMVSVIVPTYNYGRYIIDAVKSLQDQTYNNWECIIVDDGSTDTTKDIVRTLSYSDNRLKYIYQENQYQAVGKNTGLKTSQGDYIQFLDADDMLEPNKLENQVAFMEQHNSVDITYTDTRYFPTEDSSARWYFMHPDNAEWIPKIKGSGTEIIKQIVNDNFLTINSPLIRRAVLADVGNFDEKLKLVEDWDFWIRCCLKGKHIEYNNWDGSFALVRSHESSYSRNRQQVNESTLLMREKLNKLITDTEIVSLNKALLEELKEWMANIELTKKDLKTHFSEDQSFILIDEDHLRNELINFTSIPFTENEGEYFGIPADDDDAIKELERLRIHGAEFIVLAWMSFWWLDYYKQWHQYLRTNFPCILENKRLIIFDLRHNLEELKQGTKLMKFKYWL